MKEWQKLMNSEFCKKQLVECSRVIQSEIERWLGRPMTAEELSLISNYKNWKRFSKETRKGKTTRGFICEGFLTGIVVTRHAGFSVSISLQGVSEPID